MCQKWMQSSSTMKIHSGDADTITPGQKPGSLVESLWLPAPLGRDMASSRLGARGQCLRLLKTRGFLLLKLLAAILAVLLFCEFLIYYLVIFRCSWPELKTPEGAGALGAPKAPEHVLRAMFLADTHLLGAVRGHWLDKLRREWQMERAFQTALWLLQPEVVFILGDVFDEGKWSSPEAWANDVGRFWKVFRHPPHVQLRAVAGNHDIGFHYHEGAGALGINSITLGPRFWTPGPWLDSGGSTLLSQGWTHTE